jgi:arylsulfatase A-like enzyme
MPRRRPDRPNVLVFFTDQQRWDSVGLHGNPLDVTPNLDRLARRGTHLPNAFTPQPVCAPTRACLQTGLYPTTSGIFRNHLPLSPDTRTLAHHFGAAGYDTAYIGKWHLADRDPVPPDQRGGYDSWLAANVLEFCSDAYDTVLYDEQEQAVRLPGYRVDALGDAAVRYIAAHQDAPFFLFLSLLEPHHQNHLDAYVAPDGYAERYAGRWTPPDLAALGGSAPQHLGGYWGIVKRLDEMLGRLLDALKSLSLLDDTVVVFTSDHGCHFKTRNSEYKRSCHDASVHVPTLLTGPSFTGGGHADRAVVAGAFVLAVAGLEVAAVV